MAGALADISLEPTINFQNLDAAPGSRDSDSDSDDAAGVYFGPFQSPEKKVIAASQHKEPAVGDVGSGAKGSHARRSGRFTSPLTENGDMSDANEDSDEGAGDTSHSRSGTPDNVRFPGDEPSSVLASRIIRAHGGPSPPPRARHPATFAPSPLKDSLTFPTHDDESETPNVDSELGRRFRAMFDRPASPSPQTDADMPGPPALTIRRASLSPSATPPPLVANPDASQRDLISFDSFSIPSVTPIPEAAGPSLPISHSLLEPSGGLLSPSPRRATSPFHTGLLAADLQYTSPVRRSPRLSVAMQLPPAEEPSSSNTLPVSPFLLPVAPAAQETPPPRRSPRRSATPQGRTPKPSTPEPMPALPNLDSAQEQASPARKKWKGKAKAISPDNATDSAHITNIEDGWEELNSNDLKGEAELEAEKARRRRLQNECKEKDELMARETNSLSPDSANVLEQLWPSQPELSPIEQPPNAEIAPPDVQPPAAPVSPPPVALVFPPPTPANPLLTSVRRVAIDSPLRAGSPSRGNHSLKINDLMRSPARRVQAPTPGPSAQRPGFKDDVLAGAIVRAPVFSRPFGESQTSPAKRVPFADSKSPAKSTGGPMMVRASKSPSRGPSRERSASAEPRPTIMRARSASVERSGHRSLEPPSASKPRSMVNLPFPLVSSTNDRPTTIPEETEPPTTSSTNITAATQVPGDSSPMKSNLKQPSTSKIPRIGAKPYARPSSSTRDKEVKTAVAIRKAGTIKTSATKSLRAVKPARSSGSSSDDPGGSSNAAHTKAVSATPTNLKRKRTADKPSPSQSKPVVLIRQVVPGTLGQKMDGSSSIPASRKVPLPNRTNSSPIKKPQQPMVMRKVTRQPKELAAFLKVSDLPKSEEERVTAEHATNLAKMDEDDPLLMTDKPAAIQDEPMGSSPDPLAEALPQSSDSVMPRVSSPTQDDDEPEIKVRRTTRARKQVPGSDPFTVAAPRPVPSRRKAPASSRMDDGFAGLTAVALKALTSSNTTRNQHNFVSLATEVVRKDGNRPESPMVKIRTISQREEEERVKGRAERAQRRARKSDGGLDEEEDGSDRGDSSNLGDGDWVEVEPAWGAGYRRGPGDEEDYKSPARPEPPLKRPRFNDEADEADDLLEKKRVKWDRGLYSEIYLDEIEVNPNNWRKDVVIKKGCLAPHAKALRLDHLGNIVNDAPLNDLVQQNIIVKKFVYDNEIELEAPPVVKATRSRSKKKN
ncbi:hypothetical protein HWV62_39976 [Athelia sp. TMB]|nr:hypothetical protein HWV62_39976 [Athelia sp. TMB]